MNEEATAPTEDLLTVSPTCATSIDPSDKPVRKSRKASKPTKEQHFVSQSTKTDVPDVTSISGKVDKIKGNNVLLAKKEEIQSMVDRSAEQVEFKVEDEENENEKFDHMTGDARRSNSASPCSFTTESVTLRASSEDGEREAEISLISNCIVDVGDPVAVRSPCKSGQPQSNSSKTAPASHGIQERSPSQNLKVEPPATDDKAVDRIKPACGKSPAASLLEDTAENAGPKDNTQMVSTDAEIGQPIICERDEAAEFQRIKEKRQKAKVAKKKRKAKEKLAKSENPPNEVDSHRALGGAAKDPQQHSNEPHQRNPRHEHNISQLRILQHYSRDEFANATNTAENCFKYCGLLVSSQVFEAALTDLSGITTQFTDPTVYKVWAALYNVVNNIRPVQELVVARLNLLGSTLKNLEMEDEAVQHLQTTITQIVLRLIACLPRGTCRAWDFADFQMDGLYKLSGPLSVLLLRVFDLMKSLSLWFLASHDTLMKS